MLHGICYAFFFATVYIFVDEYLPEGRPLQRAGPVQPADPGHRLAGRQFHLPVAAAGGLYDDVADGAKVTDFRACSWCRCCFAIGAAIALALFFHPPKKEATGETVAPPH